MELIYRGKCWKFGDNLSVDHDLMPHEFSTTRETRLEILREHVMEHLDPEFHKQTSPGDIIVAGKRFGQGNPHIQGFLGIAGLKLGLVVESIPRGSFRNAVNAGVPFLPYCSNVTSQVETGDELLVNFETGEFKNLTRNLLVCYKPLDNILLKTIAMGGWRPMVTQRLAKKRPK